MIIRLSTLVGDSILFEIIRLPTKWASYTGADPGNDKLSPKQV